MAKSIEDVLYPKIEPYTTGMLPVSDLHTIAWECSGNPEGIPVIVIHGVREEEVSHPTAGILIQANGISYNLTKEDVVNQLHMLN